MQIRIGDMNQKRIVALFITIVPPCFEWKYFHVMNENVENVFLLFSKFLEIWSPFPKIENENF